MPTRFMKKRIKVPTKKENIWYVKVSKNADVIDMAVSRRSWWMTIYQAKDLHSTLGDAIKFCEKNRYGDNVRVVEQQTR